MKKSFIVFGFVLVAAIGYLVFKVSTVTDPYVVAPTAVLQASEVAKPGYTFDSATRSLSVVSKKEVIVISDPGVSFKYVVIWISEKTRKEKADGMMEYRFQLPEFTAVEHINPIGTAMPPKIEKVAGGGDWR